MKTVEKFPEGFLLREKKIKSVTTYHLYRDGSNQLAFGLVGVYTGPLEHAVKLARKFIRFDVEARAIKEELRNSSAIDYPAERNYRKSRSATYEGTKGGAKE